MDVFMYMRVALPMGYNKCGKSFKVLLLLHENNTTTRAQKIASVKTSISSTQIFQSGMDISKFKLIPTLQHSLWNYSLTHQQQGSSHIPKHKLVCKTWNFHWILKHQFPKFQQYGCCIKCFFTCFTQFHQSYLLRS